MFYLLQDGNTMRSFIGKTCSSHSCALRWISTKQFLNILSNFGSKFFKKQKDCCFISFQECCENVQSSAKSKKFNAALSASHQPGPRGDERSFWPSSTVGDHSRHGEIWRFPFCDPKRRWERHIWIPRGDYHGHPTEREAYVGDTPLQGAEDDVTFAE